MNNVDTRTTGMSPPLLPLEMWEKIMSHLPSQAHCKVARVCKAFHALSERVAPDDVKTMRLKHRAIEVWSKKSAKAPLERKWKKAAWYAIVVSLVVLPLLLLSSLAVLACSALSAFLPLTVVFIILLFLEPINVGISCGIVYALAPFLVWLEEQFDLYTEYEDPQKAQKISLAIKQADVFASFFEEILNVNYLERYGFINEEARDELNALLQQLVKLTKEPGPTNLNELDAPWIKLRDEKIIPNLPFPLGDQE